MPEVDSRPSPNNTSNSGKYNIIDRTIVGKLFEPFIIFQ